MYDCITQVQDNRGQRSEKGEGDNAWVEVPLLCIYSMWRSHVEIEGYSVAYLDHIAVFEVPGSYAIRIFMYL